MVKNKKILKHVAIFDVDGTIFRSSLLIEVVRALLKEGIFASSTEKIYIRAHKRWLDRKDSYENYVDAVVKAFKKNIKNVNYHHFLKVVKRVIIFHKDRVYCYTRDLVRKLKKENYYLLAISHSPKLIVESFCKEWGFDKVYGELYEFDKKRRFTGKTLCPTLVGDKSQILKRVIEKEKLTLEKSIGVGDTESDVPFLKMVEKPICFNPNQNLYKLAKKMGWSIVVERKDVIYHL